jgi:DNA mismatch repair ATPase MutS
MFTSTTVQDALFLGRNVLEYALKLDVICLYVTFLDELTHIDKTVSLVSTVDPLNPDLRTYKIERKPADGLSYAIALAKKNHVTFEEITQRIQS